jgi:hypothetical protein
VGRSGNNAGCARYVQGQARRFGELAPSRKASGKDVRDGIVEVKEHRLYELLALGNTMNGFLELVVSEPGLEAYAFTFGEY